MEPPAFRMLTQEEMERFVRQHQPVRQWLKELVEETAPEEETK